MMIRVEYESNNSGGSWWLTDDDWRALEEAGWDVAWFATQEGRYFQPGDDGRWLGALARSASKEVERPQDAIDEWSRITGQSPSEEGCNCCGPPHSFSYRDEDGRYRYTTVEVTETRLSWS